MDGRELAEEVFHNIGLNENHEISNNDVVRVISFWGFNEDSSRSTRIGFVCYCAREKIRKAFEKGLVYRDFKLFDELMESINDYRVKQSESADDDLPYKGQIFDTHYCNFCPNCGAKMGGGENDNK